MLTMFARLLTPPNRSFFLLGPRATGKTTWIQNQLENVGTRIDLLKSDLYLSYLQDPSRLRAQVSHVGSGWIVIDEVQRIPQLLNEVHSLLFESDNALKFCLTGSSARKLRRAEANMLAGRALTRAFYPLSIAEIGATADISRLLSFGSLPFVYSAPTDAIDILDSYLATYLETEIQQEAVTRDLPAFSRFLKIAALINGQTVTTTSIARDAGVKRPTVERYFQILIDTLIGSWLPAWQPRRKVREVVTPKFYLFDAGVVRVTQGRTRERVRDEEKGVLLETVIFNELKIALNVLSCGGALSYYRSSEKAEVDFIWHRGDTAVGIEVKASTRWRSEFGTTLTRLHSEGVITSCIGVYLGEYPEQHGPLKVLPIKDFVDELHQGNLLREL
jgi:uncharacterized protein